MREMPPFEVLLISGASGVGKTNIAYQLSDVYHVNVVQVDDFQRLVESITKESDFPVFHYWKNHFEEAIQLPTEQKLEIMISYANQLSVFLEDIIDNHLEDNRPMIMEGDFISPDLCKKVLSRNDYNGRVKCLIVSENSKDKIVNNFQKREGRPQLDRAEVSHLYNNWLVEQAKESKISIVSSMSWETSLKRIRAILEKNQE